MKDKSIQDNADLGKYGLMAMRFLQEYHPARLSQLILNGQLTRILQDVNKEAKEMLSFLTENTEKELPLPDTATDEERVAQRQLIFELCEAAVIGEVVNRKR